MLMAGQVPLCLALLWVVLRSAAALPSPSEPIYEDQVYQEQQQAAAPIGRPDFQAQALEDFATGLAADPYGALPLWVADSHPCGDGSNNYRAWPGVTCDAPTGFVTAIQLTNKGLSGTLPSSISVLKTLRTLDLANNSFYGPLPSSYSNLTLLEMVDLSHNQLSGTLPAVYSAWDALQSLELHHNALTGPLPGAWAGLNLLEVVDLSSNNFTGSLPGSWARMQYLSVLDVHNNSLTGTLPAAWSEQRSLLQLNLGDNSITGVLPADWASGMDSVRGINVTGNSLTGALPGEWSNMTSLQALSVSHNQLTGPIPAAWSGLHNLYRVNVTRNEGICGEVPTGIAGALDDANTTNLNNRCQWDTDAGHLLAFKAAMSDPLNVLASWKEASNPCGAEPWQGVVCQDGWVVAIKLEGSALRGPLNDDLMRITRLQALYLERNQLYGSLPTSWGTIAPATLATLDLSSNQLTGPLPEEWSRISSLQLLDLSSNGFIGQLPDDWSTLKNLSVLLLGSNTGLNGTLPSSWASLVALQKVHVDQSSIEGSLPASWAKLISVQELGLSNNLLTGSLPQMWPKKLSSLKVLDLSGNQQMCGPVQDLPLDVTLRRTATGIGSQCKSQQGVSATTAIIAGVCGGVVGAALLAGAAFLLYRSRQAPIRYLSSRWPSIAVTSHSLSRPRSQSVAPSPVPASPTPTVMLAATPPTTPLHGPMPAATLSTGSLLAAAAAAGGQHRLAVGSAAGYTPPITPKSTPGPIAEEALFGAGNLLCEPTSAHIVSLISQGQSCPGSPPSPRVVTRTGLDSALTPADPNSPAPSSMPTLITGSPIRSISYPSRSPMTLPIPMSPGGFSSRAGSPAPAAMSPGGSPLATPRHAVEAGEPGRTADNVATVSSPHRCFGHSLSMPGSPGTWGSAVKVHEHGAVGAGPSTRVGGMDGLMARVAMMRMAEAAAAASTDGGSPVSSPSSEAGASCGGSSMGSPIMSGAASPAIMSGRASPLLPLGNGPLRPPGLALTHFPRLSDPGWDCGSPMPTAQPASPRTVLMGAAACATEASVPSPRGCAALMTAGLGPVVVTVAGQEAGEMLSPGLVAEAAAVAAARNERQNDPFKC